MRRHHYLLILLGALLIALLAWLLLAGGKSDAPTAEPGARAPAPVVRLLEALAGPTPQLIDVG